MRSSRVTFAFSMFDDIGGRILAATYVDKAKPRGLK
jgi:hypothetical protein